MYYNGVGYNCAQPCVPVVPVAGCGGGCGFGGCCCAFILVLFILIILCGCGCGCGGYSPINESFESVRCVK